MIAKLILASGGIGVSLGTDRAEDSGGFKMDQRKVDDHILLVPYYPNEDIAIAWYQDKELCRQVDNIDHVYSRDRLRAMYDFLSSHGECFYIQYKGKLIGDVSLRDNSEIAIVICREYQNRHIGRKCVWNMIELAKEKGMRQVRANIYAFNKQSQRMFWSIGFRPAEDEWYVYDIEQLQEKEIDLENK